METSVILSLLLSLLLLNLAQGITVDEDSTNVKCFKTSTQGTSYSCYRSGVLSTCKIDYLHSAKTDKHAIECVPPEQVEGMVKFCHNILERVKNVTVENLNIDKTTSGPIGTESIGKSSQFEEKCLETAVLVSIALGSFAVGCFVMSIILALCKCIDPCRGKGDLTRNGSSPSKCRSHQQASSRATAEPRSPSSLSVDSGLSSTNLTTPRHAMHDSSPAKGSKQIFHFDTRGPSIASKGSNCAYYPTTDMEGVYAPVSECSYRDYQSIQGSLVYAPSSEGGNSDYSCHPTHRVLLIRENGEIYQCSSDSSSNDYSSLKGARGLNNGGIYYAVSDGSYKDYTSLLDESELAAAYCDVEDSLVGATAGNKLENTKFRVSGFIVPKSKFSASRVAGHALQNVSEYEVLHANEEAVLNNEYTLPVDDISNTLSNEPVNAGVCEGGSRPGGVKVNELALMTNLAKKSLPHEYLVLEKEQDKGNTN